MDIKTSIFQKAFETGLLDENPVITRRIKSLTEFFSEQYSFFSPLDAEVIPFFGERRRHLTCKRKSIFIRPSFSDPIYTILFIEFISNLCGEEIVIVKSVRNLKWVELMEQNVTFRMKYKFADSLNPVDGNEVIYLLDQLQDYELMLKNCYVESLDKIIITDAEMFQRESKVLGTFLSERITITNDLGDCTRNSIVFSTSGEKVPDVKYVFLHTSPLEIFVEYPELLPKLFEGFVAKMLFNEVVVVDKVYSLKESKKSFLDSMPASKGKVKKLFNKVNREVNEKEIEKLFLNKLNEQ